MGGSWGMGTKYRGYGTKLNSMGGIRRIWKLKKGIGYRGQGTQGGEEKQGGRLWNGDGDKKMEDMGRK